MHLRAYAKINPYLKIEGERSDGYHDLSIIFRPVSLYDEIDVEIDENKKCGVTLCCNINEFSGNDNIIHKAYEALKAKFLNLPAFNVSLIKKIPSGAGMGGGSSDASAFLYAVNYLCNLGLSLNELAEIGSYVGADVAPLMFRYPTYGTGIGDNLFPIKTEKINYYVVVKPTVSFNTGLMYREFDIKNSEGRLKQKSNYKAIIKSIESGDIKSESKKYYNVFEKVIPEKKLISKIKKELISLGALGAQMTGSGSAVFASFSSKKERNLAYKKLVKEVNYNVYCCEDVLEYKRNVYYVYILEMEDGSLYTGYTNNLEKRLKAHNSNRGAKYTKTHGFGKIVHFETFDTKSDALSREYAIKQLTKKDKILLINNGNK